MKLQHLLNGWNKCACTHLTRVIAATNIKSDCRSIRGLELARYPSNPALGYIEAFGKSIAFFENRKGKLHLSSRR